MSSLTHNRLQPSRALTGDSSSRGLTAIVIILTLALGLTLGHTATASHIDHSDCPVCQVLQHSLTTSLVDAIAVLSFSLLPVRLGAASTLWRGYGCNQQRAPPFHL